MEPDWADEKAEAVGDELGRYLEDGYPSKVVRIIAAALREAREHGAREERRECHEVCNATTRRYGTTAEASEAIAARVPMSKGVLSDDHGTH